MKQLDDISVYEPLLGATPDDARLAPILDAVGNPPLERFGVVAWQSAKGIGVDFMFAPPGGDETVPPDQFRLAAIHFHADPLEPDFRMRLPGGLDVSANREQVWITLGKPTTAGGGGNSSITEQPKREWDRYERGASALTFEYDDSGAIAMVTLSCVVLGGD